MDTTIHHYGTSTSKSNKNLKLNSTLRQEDRPKSNNDELVEYSTIGHTRNRKAAQTAQSYNQTWAKSTMRSGLDNFKEEYERRSQLTSLANSKDYYMKYIEADNRRRIQKHLDFKKTFLPQA